MIGFPIGLVAANASEWFIHKYVLHGLGRRKNRMWSFHWHEHHAQSRRNGFKDADYERPTFGWHAQGKEVYGLLGLGLTVLPLVKVAPWFCAAVWLSTYNYYRVHKKAHLDPAWARERVPWHYDHHMGPNQDANWCVTHPLFDLLMGSREHYAGTDHEQRDRIRLARREAKPTESDPPSAQSAWGRGRPREAVSGRRSAVSESASREIRNSEPRSELKADG
jgi:hypothetical protein